MPLLLSPASISGTIPRTVQPPLLEHQLPSSIALDLKRCVDKKKQPDTQANAG